MNVLPVGATNRDSLMWLLSHGSDLGQFIEWEREWKACGCGNTLCCSKCLYRNDPGNYIPSGWWAL